MLSSLCLSVETLQGRISKPTGTKHVCTWFPYSGFWSKDSLDSFELLKMNLWVGRGTFVFFFCLFYCMLSIGSHRGILYVWSQYFYIVVSVYAMKACGICLVYVLITCEVVRFWIMRITRRLWGVASVMRMDWFSVLCVVEVAENGVLVWVLGWFVSVIHWLICLVIYVYFMN